MNKENKAYNVFFSYADGARRSNGRECVLCEGVEHAIGKIRTEYRHKSDIDIWNVVHVATITLGA